MVSLGATLRDGRPHPGAGTGFLISHGLTFNRERSSADAASEQVFEIMQVRWGGETLLIPSRQLVSALLGHALTDMGISNYVSDETGFLVPFMTPAGTDVFRFEHGADGWQAVEHGTPFLTSAEGEREPSLVKTDTCYLAYTRGNDPVGRLYRSEKGFDFELLTERPNPTVPQVLNRTAAGELYLTTNSNRDMLRNPLIACPLTAEGVFGDAVVIHDQDGVRDDKGPSVPFVDHGIGSDIMLEGHRRHLLAYRVCDLRERTLHASQAELARTFHAGGAPAERRAFGGIYVAEVE